MDDKDALRIATDCMPADADMLDADDCSLPVNLPDQAAEAGLALVAPDGPAEMPGPDEAFEETCEDGAPEPDGDAHHRRIIEALLFSSDAPVSAGRLAALLDGCTPTKVRLLIADLNDRYRDAGLSFRIEAIARGYQMMTQPEFQPWIAKLHKQRSETRLSPAAMETLSIVAYKQPVIRADVEAIRGVACGEVLSRLRDMGLVRILGRAEIVGRPLLYGTTRKFLDVFGLSDLDDLPPLEALSLKPQSKTIEEVEPVAPPAIPEPPAAPDAPAIPDLSATEDVPDPTPKAIGA